MYNLLEEGLIRYKTESEAASVATLPKVYAALVEDDIASFPSLRPHQRHAWHAFLVQLGAMSLHRAEWDHHVLPDDPEDWATVIRGLTTEFPGDEPWHLVVTDITKPAFMQPPATTAEQEKEFKTTVSTPDELDMLVTSKNHDLKAAVAAGARSDDWVFALVTLQTMEGFGGAGNYGISRMNGGLGNRPAFSLAPQGPKPGAHVVRDIRALLERRSAILNDNPHYSSGSGTSLLWLLAWDGTPSEALQLQTFDLFYIEVCRRIRLNSDDDGLLSATRAISRAARVESKDLKGRTGDPWTPTNTKREGLPLTLGAGGFNFRRMSEYLNPEAWKLPDLMRLTPSEQDSKDDLRLVARAMVRGRGKTEGYYERAFPIRSGFQEMMANQAAAEDLARIFRERIDQVSIVQRVLSNAIQTFIARGIASNVSAEQRALARPWLDKHDAIIDATFFHDLQTELEIEGNAARAEERHRWLLEGPMAGAREVLRQAEYSLPCSSILRFRAQVAADGLFEGRLRTEFPACFGTPGDEE